MNLHAQIMNLHCDGATLNWANTREAYLYGHRDARHAAAELALKADETRDQLLAALKRLIAAHDAHDTMHAEDGDDVARMIEWAAAEDEARAAIAAAEGQK